MIKLMIKVGFGLNVSADALGAPGVIWVLSLVFGEIFQTLHFVANIAFELNGLARGAQGASDMH